MRSLWVVPHAGDIEKMVATRTPAAAESDHREQHEILPKEQCVRGPVSITTAKVSDFALIGPVSRRQTNEEFVTTSCRTMVAGSSSVTTASICDGEMLDGD